MENENLLPELWNEIANRLDEPSRCSLRNVSLALRKSVVRSLLEGDLVKDCERLGYYKLKRWATLNGMTRSYPRLVKRKDSNIMTAGWFAESSCISIDYANGFNHLGINSTGEYNAVIGHEAGVYMTQRSKGNIYFCHPGVKDESYAIRIGDESNATYIAGIHGKKTESSALPVYIDAEGKLGTEPFGVRGCNSETYETLSKTVSCCSRKLNLKRC